MNNTILVVLPFCTNDGVLAEHLCDFIYLVNKRVQSGHVLLVPAGDVHDELKEKVRLAAAVAFETVDVLPAPKIVDPNKNVHINKTFLTVAEHIAKTYRVPFLWLEPDAVPLKYGWLEAISDAHYQQPKRYSGAWKKVLTDNRIFLNRIAVYPPDAITDLAASLATQGLFNLAAGAVVTPKSTKSNLVHEVAFTDESVKVRSDAVLMHSDKAGIYMNLKREEFELAATKKKK